MSGPEATDVITAAIAVGAFLLSIITASYSMRIARASEDSAKAARDSAEVARAVRDQGDAPEFNITPQAPAGTSWPIDIEMMSGPPSVKVQVSYIGETMKDKFGHPVGLQNRHMIQAAVGTKFRVEVESIQGATRNNGRIILVSEEEGVDDPRVWPHVREINWKKPTSRIIV